MFNPFNVPQEPGPEGANSASFLDSDENRRMFTSLADLEHQIRLGERARPVNPSDPGYKDIPYSAREMVLIVAAGLDILTKTIISTVPQGFNRNVMAHQIGNVGYSVMALAHRLGCIESEVLDLAFQMDSMREEQDNASHALPVHQN